MNTTIMHRQQLIKFESSLFEVLVVLEVPVVLCWFV